MNTTLKTALIVLGVLIVAGEPFFAGQIYNGWQTAPVYGYGWMPMMGGRGWGNDNC